MTSKTARKALGRKKPKAAADPTELIPASHIARELGVGRPNLRYWERAGRFLGTRIDGQVFYTAEQFAAMKEFKALTLSLGLGRPKKEA